MQCNAIIASSSSSFSSLEVVSDIWVKDCDIWCGDYPYLNKYKFKKFLKFDMGRKADEESIIADNDSSMPAAVFEKKYNYMDDGDPVENLLKNNAFISIRTMNSKNNRSG